MLINHIQDGFHCDVRKIGRMNIPLARLTESLSDPERWRRTWGRESLSLSTPTLAKNAS